MSASNAGRIGVFGASGSGKSSYVKRRIRIRKRMVVFDPLEEYGGLGFQVVRHDRADALDQVRQLMAKDWPGFRIAYVPPSGKEPAALSALSKLMLAAQGPFRERGGGAGMTLIVEEMNMGFPVHGGAEKSPGFAEICSRGRHYGIEVFGVSQRIAEVSTRFRGNMTEAVILRQQGRNDLLAAESAIGGGKAQISALQNLQYLHERNGEITSGKISF